MLVIKQCLIQDNIDTIHYDFNNDVTVEVTFLTWQEKSGCVIKARKVAKKPNCRAISCYHEQKWIHDVSIIIIHVHYSQFSTATASSKKDISMFHLSNSTENQYTTRPRWCIGLAKLKKNNNYFTCMISKLGIKNCLLR